MDGVSQRRDYHRLLRSPQGHPTEGRNLALHLIRMQHAPQGSAAAPLCEMGCLILDRLPDEFPHLVGTTGPHELAVRDSPEGICMLHLAEWFMNRLAGVHTLVRSTGSLREQP